MNGYGSLASTGVGTIAIGGLVFDQTWLIALAGLLIVLGVIAVRLGFRKGKTPTEV